MTESNSRSPTCGAPIETQPLRATEPTASAAKEEARETDHRGVVMPSRTRIGGIIMPQ